MSNLVSSTLAHADALIGAHDFDADWWFAALDQRPVWVGAERWLTQVVGIHVDGFELWIQMEAVRDQIRSFVIRVGARVTLAEVMADIERRIANG